MPARDEQLLAKGGVHTAECQRLQVTRSAPPHLPDSHPGPEDISPGILDRFTKEKEPIRLTLVEPIVVEVSADVALSGRSFRHPLRCLRSKPELNPC